MDVHGLDERLARLARQGDNGPNPHGVVVTRHGEVIAEYYGAGEDFAWGTSLGLVTFGADTLHDMRSVSKSVVALLYGIALDRGQVPAPDEPLLRSFDEYADLAADPRRAALTVEHALTMTLAVEWDESPPYTTAANSEIAMELAPDRYRFVLERPMTGEPGRQWSYCGGATALLGRLIGKGTGLALPEFARVALFEPLGIDAFEWMAGNDGVAAAASGLRLTPRGLARIGQLVLDAGMDIVSPAWLAAMLRPRVRIDERRGYGYQWYLSTGAEPAWRFAAMGNGGQRLFVLPDHDLVVAVTVGDYDTGDQSRAPDAILAEVFGR
jgi:CubicO group peptidase (beta-lactamase class C family)